jgi:hypothetical protein
MNIKWIIKQLIPKLGWDSIMDLLWAMLWRTFNGALKDMTGWVAEAQALYPGTGHQDEKFNYVWQKAIDKYKSLRLNQRRLNWLIETAVMMYKDTSDSVASEAKQLDN